MNIIVQWICNNIIELCMGFFFENICSSVKQIYRWIKNKFIIEKEEFIKAYGGILPIDHSEPEYLYKDEQKNIVIRDSGKTFFISPDMSSDDKWNILMQSGYFSTFDKIMSLEEIRDCFDKTLVSVVVSSDNNSIYAISRVVCNRINKDELSWATIECFHTDEYTKKFMNCFFANLCKKNEAFKINELEDFTGKYGFIYGLQLEVLLVNSIGNILLKCETCQKNSVDQTKSILTLWNEDRILIKNSDIDLINLDLKEVMSNDLKEQNISINKNRIKIQDLFFDKERMNLVIGAEAEVIGKIENLKHELISSNTKEMIQYLKKGKPLSNSCRYSLFMRLSRLCIEEVVGTNDSDY